MLEFGKIKPVEGAPFGVGEIPPPDHFLECPDDVVEPPSPAKPEAPRSTPPCHQQRRFHSETHTPCRQIRRKHLPLASGAHGPFVDCIKDKC